MNRPTGTITFLFTDIEGSTRLWESHPEQMRLAVARHDEILRQAVEQNDGYLFKTTGDGITAAFAVAADALAAALAAQLALEVEPWPEPAVLQSRVGLHTGAAEFRDGDYFGQPLNRCARLMSAGHGGQTLVSSVTSDLCRDTLPQDAVLRSLGEHRLKDLTRPETIYQLVHPSLALDFPTLRTLDNPALPNNLPRQLTSFVGREKDIAAVKSLIPKTSLLTMTGSGGCGKTRLSLQVAADMLEEYPEGAWQVELASLSDPALVPQALASSLGLREQRGQTMQQTLIDSLKSKHLLLLLDNAEHLLPACAAIAATLLRSCPQVKIIVTSREPLGIAGELTYRVPSLSLPNFKEAKKADAESLSQFEAVRLFIERALFVKPDFIVTNANAPALAQLCHRLDGIPLAIELAAARVRSLTVEQINDRLTSRFQLLVGGDRLALPRQQTLRALIDWSYDLLTDSEKTMLGRLSVFAGGWFLDAAEKVTSAEPVESWQVLDLLTSLADKSLILAEETQESHRERETRYRMLETVRQYAHEKVSANREGEAVHKRYISWSVALAEEADQRLAGPEQVKWLSHLDIEHDNLRSALDDCIRFAADATENHSRSVPACLRLAGALGEFWSVRGYLSEGRQQLDRALAASGAIVLPEHDGSMEAPSAEYIRAVAYVLLAAGRLMMDQGEYAAAQEVQKEALMLFQRINDRQGVANTRCGIGAIAYVRGEYAAARAIFDENLAFFRETIDDLGVAKALRDLGMVALGRSNYAEATTFYEESLALYRKIGHKNGIAGALNSLGYIASERGDYTAARLLFGESLALSREIGDKVRIASSSCGDGLAACDQGDYPTAQTLLEESLAICREIGDRRGTANTLNNIGLTAYFQGNYEAARFYVAESLAYFREAGHKGGVANISSTLGLIMSDLKDFAAARVLLEESLTLCRELSDKVNITYGLTHMAAVLDGEGNTQGAVALRSAADALRISIGAQLSPADQADQNEKITMGKATLGETAFAEAWELGSSMDWDQAVAVALGELE